MKPVTNKTVKTEIERLENLKKMLGLSLSDEYYLNSLRHLLEAMAPPQYRAPNN